MPIAANPNVVMTAVMIMAPRTAALRSAKLVTSGRMVNLVTAGTAEMMPIQAASMPTPLSHTGKNGNWLPLRANIAP